MFGRHVACNPDAFCWLAVPVARGQPVVANAVGRCLVKGGCLVLLFFGNVNLCLLRLLVHFAFCNVCLLQDTVGPLLAWLYKFSGPVTSRKLAATGRLLV